MLRALGYCIKRTALSSASRSVLTRLPATAVTLTRKKKLEKERLKNGIPYHPEVIDWFTDIAGELQLPNRFE